MASDLYTDKLVNIFDKEDKSWKRYENEKGFLAFVSPIDDVTYTQGNADVYIKPLPFYGDVSLIQIRYLDENVEPAFYFFLKYGHGEYVQLKGSSDVIHEVNEESELNITFDNVFDYLKFFNMFTVNDEGFPFYVIEGQQSEFIRDYSEYEKTRHLRKFIGSSVKDASEMGVYAIHTRILCGGYLYDCDFEVTKDGFVEMIEDKLIGSV